MNNITWFLLGVAVMLAVSLCLYANRKKRQKTRVSSLTQYLELASKGKETALTHIEDEFSILEDEMYKTVSELRIAREEAQRERKQQADNLADIAHQLKTPLTSMSLMTQLLCDEATTEQHEYISRIDSQLNRLNWLTGSLLTMSRLDAGAIEFSPEAITFTELVAMASEPMEQLLKERNQVLTIVGNEISLSCDAYWTAEALINLIKNSSEHTPQGGEIILSAKETPLYLEITLEDSGNGFCSEEISYLFKRFFKGKNSHKDSIGIGLALSKGIIEGQGGIIRAENRPNGGARFLIRFYP